MQAATASLTTSTRAQPGNAAATLAASAALERPARPIPSAIGLGDHAADKFADDADPGVEINVNVGRRADLVSEFASLRIAQPGPAARRAAVHADEEFRPRHAPGPQKFVGDH
jgi:hypothetical protein